MKVLVIGGGGREHALAWKVGTSPRVEEIYCAPGNAGISRIATCVPIDTSSVAELAEFALSKRIDLTVVGPELPLTLGISEEFARRGLALFGASREAATIESSKIFAKEFMVRHGIPTAAHRVFSSHAEARAFVGGKEAVYPLVVKADGLAAGKGVVVCQDRRAATEAVAAMMEGRVHGDAGERILIEEFLEGRELSFFAITDGSRAMPLATCQDFKRVRDGDQGPNTGGMGAYSPSVYVDADLLAQIRDRVLGPTISGLAEEGRPYRGVLYIGLMLTREGPRVLEYNARFGDPEAQVLLPRVASDLVPVLASAASGRLDERTIEWRAESAATVVLASEGYPGPHERGMRIQGIDDAEKVPGVIVFHSGTRSGGGGEVLVGGGRVIAVTGLGPDLDGAVACAYEGVSRIRFQGMHHRSDIGRDAILALRAASTT